MGGPQEPEPPDVPYPLVQLSIDQVTNNLQLDSHRLETTLRRMVDYPKAMSYWISDSVRFELDASLRRAKAELALSVKEACNEVEANLNARVDSVEDTATSASQKAASCEYTLEKMNREFGENVLEALELARQQPTANVPSGPGSPSAMARNGTAQDLLEPNISRNPTPSTSRAPTMVQLPLPSEAEDRADSTERLDVAPRRPVPAALRASVSGEAPQELGKMASNSDIADLQEKAQQAESVVHSVRQQVLFFEKRFQTDIERLQKLVGTIENNGRSTMKTMESLGPEITGNQKRIEELQQTLAGLQNAIAKVKSEGAAATDGVSQRVHSLNIIMGVGTGDPTVADRVISLEGASRQLEKTARNHGEEAASLRKAVEELQARAAQIEADASEAAERAFADVDGRCHPLEEHSREVNEKLGNVEEQLSRVHNALTVLPTKADNDDLLDVRQCVTGLVRDLKDKEQAVLFGARCLSCNRVFDEVQVEAGTVSVQTEKQKAQLWAEVQHALNSPRPDPGLIRMLAVKVGRAGNIGTKAGLGPIEGRDAASYACGMDDVGLVPVRGSWPPTSDKGTRLLVASHLDRTALASPTAQQQSPTTSPTATVKSPRRRARPETSGTQGEHGPMDFKHPLSSLVSRGALS